MMNYSNQIRQHNKEASFIQKLSDYCKETNKWFVDCTGTKADYIEGIDCYIDRRPYDLKCSDTKKLTIHKTLPNGYKYKPQERHTDIPYLYCLPTSGLCYVITKAELSAYIEYYKQAGKLSSMLSNYSGDGNQNVCIDIGPMLINKEPLFKIKKDDPWDFLFC